MEGSESWDSVLLGV